MTDAGSPGSTIADSMMDDNMTTHASSPVRMDPDPRSSLHHVIDRPLIREGSQMGTPLRQNGMSDDEDEDTTPGVIDPMASSAAEPLRFRKKKDKDNIVAQSSMTQSIYSGNKVRHLKKDDGEPLWRKDIQYDFLKLVFENDLEVFTNSYEPERIGMQTFADVYIDAMARSSKTSKILKDKLTTEHGPAKNMAMVCLLVNLGRMNTTLNFFPEMRAQLRTYHAIPSLQAHQDPNSYKQLQDAPRLKSILKGASEDRTEPTTLEALKAISVPRTNPVNLIFVLSQFAPKVTELHFPKGRDFYDLIMRTSLSSKSRATAFLWLMWFYLESDFTEEGSEENPFGPGVVHFEELRNQGVPYFETLSPTMEAAENIDTPEEIEYGENKMKERKRIIEADLLAFQAEVGAPPKRGPKPKLNLPPDEGGQAMGRVRSTEGGAIPASMISHIRPRYESDLDSTRSTPPRSYQGGVRIPSVLNKGRGSFKASAMEGSSPVTGPFERVSQMRRPRPLTSHQLAVERNRNQRVAHYLTRGLRKEHAIARKRRKQEGIFSRAIARAAQATDPFEDSEGEDSMQKPPGAFRSRGFIGLVQLSNEEDDFGEELAAYGAAFRRISRRLNRWESQKGLKGEMGTHRPISSRPSQVQDIEETEDDQPALTLPRLPNNKRPHDDVDEDLDDMEKEILGLENEHEGRDEDEEEMYTPMGSDDIRDPNDFQHYPNSQSVAAVAGYDDTEDDDDMDVN